MAPARQPYAYANEQEHRPIYGVRPPVRPDPVSGVKMKKFILLFTIMVSIVAIMGAKYNLERSGNQVKSFVVTCGTAATAIEASTDEGYTSVQCTQLGSTEIYLGGSNVTPTNGYPVCSNSANCGVNTQVLSSNNAYCIVASGTQTLKCLAVVK